MIAILYPLKMTKNLYEAYSSIYEVSADLAIRAAKAAEKKRAESAKAGDTEGAKKAMRQNKKFFDYAKDKRQKENAPRKPTGPMVNKPSPDPKSSYPGTPQIMKDGKMIKNSHEPEGEMVEGYMSDDKKDHDTGGFMISQRKADEAKKRVLAKTKKKRESMKNSYEPEGEMIDEMRYNDGKSKERLEALSKKRGIPMKKMKKHPQFQPEGKFRREWEALKLIETENYREQFDTWLDGIVEEGYDIDRWSDEELVDTFINENNLWASREAVDSALLESDKKGKGSGKKDACYHKVKASASVWPSAYASGRLVQCRKKGAANYGNSSKKEDFSDWKSDIQLDEKLEKGTKGEIGFRSGGQFKDTGEKTKDGSKVVKYVQSMTTDKVTVNHPPTKKSMKQGKPKGRKRAQTPYGKAVGALMKHKSQQWDAERKTAEARKKGNTKEADKQWKKARSAEEKRKKQSGTLFDKTGDFHDRADND